MSTTRDREKFVLNPITGELDLVLVFNENRIITAQYNMAGAPYYTYDAYSNTFIPDGPKVVVDNDGNVVVV